MLDNLSWFDTNISFMKIRYLYLYLFGRGRK